MTHLSDLKSWYQKNFQQILRDYFKFLSFPSISTDPAHQKDVNATAQWLQSYLLNIGMDTTLWETKGHPIVFAQNLKAGPLRPTVLIYHHYDVQPVDPLELWKTGPFQPEERDGKVYARGASDNKGQCFYTLTALKALKELNVNVKLFIEGEEECGSEGTIAVLAEKKEALKADYLLVVDGGIPNKETPAINLGLRGILAMEVICLNSKIDLHSGVFGGVALNPNRVLVELLGKLWDGDGKVAVPGFYDEVERFSEKQKNVFNQECDPDHFRKNFGIKAFHKEKGYSLWESSVMRPTLEINGISGGYAGAGFKTVIPSKAVAKISCRLVSKQDPEKISQQIETFLKDQAPQGIDLQVISDHGGKPFLTDPGTKIVEIASSAYAEVFQKPCQKVLCGASVPIVADLCAASQAEAIVMGVSLVDDDIHAPNEHFNLECFEKGFLVMGTILNRLGET